MSTENEFDGEFDPFALDAGTPNTQQETQQEQQPPEIEIVDDTPPEDKNKPVVKTTQEDVDEEELKKYSSEVQARIKKLVWKENNERRQREQAERDRDEAVRIAELLLREKQAVEKKQGTQEEQLITATKERIDTQLQAAKKKLRDAMDSFDYEAVADAQEEIAKLAVQKERHENWQPPQKTTRQEETKPVQSEQQTPPQPRDPLADEWAKRNRSWFHVDQDMTKFALQVHERLLGAGIHPIFDAPEYYRKLDATIRAKYPEQFGETERPQRQPSVVAGVTRTPAGTVKVRLTESQKRTAERLGITVEQYARELAQLPNRS